MERRLETPEPGVTGVVLAGGLARRMGGSDKGVIPLAGRPMIEYVIDALRPQVDHLLINVNRNHQDYGRYGLQLITDPVEGFLGPLAGIAAALEASHDPLVLTVPCDGPWVPADLRRRLSLRLEESGAAVCVAHDGKRIQPVFGLFRATLMPGIRAFLESGERRLLDWLYAQEFVWADFSDHPEAFVNVNTPEERSRVERKLQKAAKGCPGTSA